MGRAPPFTTRWRLGNRALRWLGLSLLCGLGPALAEDAPALRLRVVGGLSTMAAYGRVEEPFWNRQLAQLSAGRFSADLVPIDRAGIRGEDMLTLVRNRLVGIGTVLLSRVAAQDPELAAVDLAGLSPDIAALRRHVAAYRPTLQALLRQRHGIELLAVHAYPAQLLYCKGPPAGLDALGGRRIRTAGASQADLIEGLGGRPVVARVAEVPEELREGRLDCAVAGALGGHAVGLHHLTGHLHGAAVDWGVSLLVVHSATWDGLPAELRALLQRELPRVEAATWALAEAETGEGIACNTGGAGCRSGRPGRLALVPDTPAARQRLREAFTARVLPRWIDRCGAACVAAWNGGLRAATGLEAVAPR